MVNFGDALRKGLRFCIEPKRWLPLFVLDAAVLGMAVLVLLGNMGGMMDILLDIQNNPLAAASLAGYFAGFLLLGIAWFIARLWIIGSIVHQSIRPREFRKGYAVSLGRLHKTIAVTIVVAIIASLAGAIPFGGWILSLVIGWVFFFMIQGIIIDNLGVVSTLKNSMSIFRKSPFDVFVAWLLIAIISMLIFGAFSLPLLITLFGFVWNTLFFSGSMEAEALALLMVYIQNNLVTVVALGLTALVGLELSQAFGIRAQTEFYLQLKKRFPSILKAFRGRVGRFF
jgi:hypothetical protein